MSDTSFLSVRIPAEMRNRIKAIAAGRGQSVQNLIGELVERFLAEQDRRAPALSEVVAQLRAHEASLRGRGIASLSVFGSVARGDAKPDSDIDLAIDFEPGARVSLTALAALRADLAEILGASVDLAEWTALHPHIREAAVREAVRIF